MPVYRVRVWETQRNKDNAIMEPDLCNPLNVLAGDGEGAFKKVKESKMGRIEAGSVDGETLKDTTVEVRLEDITHVCDIDLH